MNLIFAILVIWGAIALIAALLFYHPVAILLVKFWWLGGTLLPKSIELKDNVWWIRGSYAKRRVTKSKAIAFGSVVIEAPDGVTQAERRANILAGQQALKRARTALAQPGVTLDLAPEIPRYHVDAQGRLVRVLGEKKQIGKLVNGAFVENDEEEEE